MSVKHPIIAVTGSSGAGTTTVMQSFQHIFRREGIRAQVVEGDSFHRYSRMEMRAQMKEAEAAGNKHFSHFGPYSNLLGELEALFKGYGKSGGGRVLIREKNAPHQRVGDGFFVEEPLKGTTLF